MKQQKEMSARALTMEEMENVNGGHPHYNQSFYRGLRKSIRFIRDTIDVTIKNQRVIA